MWLLTPRGFFSVVADTTDAERVLVRARVCADLEALRPLLPGLEISETATRDYRFRARVERDTWTRAAAALAAEIDYPNFKDAVAERQGYERASVYARVWATLRGLQTP